MKNYEDLIGGIGGGETDNILVLSKGEREALQQRAQAELLRSHVKEHILSEQDPTIKATEAAFRYLVCDYVIM